MQLSRGTFWNMYPRCTSFFLAHLCAFLTPKGCIFVQVPSYARYRDLLHFTPPSASWLKMVERFFRDLTDPRIRRAVFRSTISSPSLLSGRPRLLTSLKKSSAAEPPYISYNLFDALH